MNYPKNYQEIIKKAIKGEWYFLAKRSDTPPLPVWYKMLAASSKEFKKLYGLKIPYVTIWEKNQTEFYMHSQEYRTVVYRTTAKLYSLKNISSHFKKMFSYCQRAQRQAQTFYNPGKLNKYSSRELLNLHNKILKDYSLSFIYGFVTWGSQVIQQEAELIINQYQKQIKSLGINLETVLGILLIPEKMSLYNKKEQALDELVVKHRRNLKDNPKLKKDINNFLAQYRWVGYDYGGPAMSYQEVIKALRSRKKKENDEITKKEIIAQCKFKQEELNIFKVLSSLSYTKDIRNLTDDYVHYCLDNFYLAIGKRYGLTKMGVRFLWPEELESLIKNERRYTKNYIKKKRDCCAATTCKVQGYKNYYIGKEAVNFKKRFIKKFQAENKTESAVIKGTIAATGKVKGRVKIVGSFSEINKVKKGDILVTSMTSPKFMPAITKAGAIVTDEGGLTCHAAIIAREIGKPSIIGTKIATKILKDNDIIEVDADKGIVNIIKR